MAKAYRQHSKSDSKTRTTAQAAVALPIRHPTSEVLETLWSEIAELSHRYLLALDQVHQLDPASDEYSKWWAEIDVVLFLIELKSRDVRAEMERLEDLMPEE
jgi:hypothetical protein